jgi:hypothetical protein
MKEIIVLATKIISGDQLGQRRFRKQNFGDKLCSYH